MRTLSIACLMAALPLGGATPAQEKASEAVPALPDYSSSILTPKAPASPRINGAKVFGVRPGHPFLFTIPATGQRPMTYGAVDLPAGLKLDAGTGRITNALGKAQRELRIVCGDRLALTPPLGWNSWNAGGPFVDTAKVRASARAMVETGLVQHGWSYVNIDDAWQGKRGGPYNAIQPNEKFPDLKGLADEVHVLYVSPLKALSNDIRKNLQEPLAGIRAGLVAMGLPDVGIKEGRIRIRGALENSGSVLLQLRVPIPVIDGLQSNLAYGATFPEARGIFWDAPRAREAWAKPGRHFLISVVAADRSIVRAFAPTSVHLLADRGGRRLAFWTAWRWRLPPRRSASSSPGASVWAASRSRGLKTSSSRRRRSSRCERSWHRSRCRASGPGAPWGWGWPST